MKDEKEKNIKELENILERNSLKIYIFMGEIENDVSLFQYLPVTHVASIILHYSKLCHLTLCKNLNERKNSSFSHCLIM